MVGGIGNVTKIPELRKRIMFTIMMLGLYRIFIFIPVPGINGVALRALLSSTGADKTGTGDARPLNRRRTGNWRIVLAGCGRLAR